MAGSNKDDHLGMQGSHLCLLFACRRMLHLFLSVASFPVAFPPLLSPQGKVTKVPVGYRPGHSLGTTATTILCCNVFFITLENVRELVYIRFLLQHRGLWHSIEKQRIASTHSVFSSFGSSSLQSS